jgi:uncharacterized protein (TIGR01777 family)
VNDQTMTVAMSGASGMIGRALVEHLTARGHRVIRLVRTQPGHGEVRWNPAAGELDPADLAGIDAAINLSGAGIGDHRWTDDYKRTLVESRVLSTELLATTLASLDPRPRILLSASAVGYYGDRGDEVLDELASPGDGFLAELCRRWEAATAPAVDAGVGVAMLRTGVVLSRHGGALTKQLPLFRLGLGSRFGSGHQWMSWITLDDHVAATTQLLTAGVTGPVNIVAPHSVTNDEFTAELARAVHRWRLPVGIPRVLPRLALGRELADHLLWFSQRARPAALERFGFQFTSPDLATALRTVLQPGSER